MAKQSYFQSRYLAHKYSGPPAMRCAADPGEHQRGRSVLTLLRQRQPPVSRRFATGRRAIGVDLKFDGLLHHPVTAAYADVEAFSDAFRAAARGGPGAD